MREKRRACEFEKFTHSSGIIFYMFYKACVDFQFTHSTNGLFLFQQGTSKWQKLQAT